LENNEVDKKDMKSDKDRKRPGRITKLCKDIAGKYGELQKKIMGKAKEFGYAKDIFEQTGEKYISIPDDPILGGVEKILEQHFIYIKQQEKDYYSFIGSTSMSGTAFSTASTANTSAILVNVGLNIESLSPPVYWPVDRSKEYSAKLSKLDQELGKMYNSTEAPEKNALYAMRQTFDHFFRIVAPDEEVRKSNFFTPKKSQKDENQVHRIERLRYAANTKVKDKKLAALLASQAEQTLEIYDKLNKLHSGEKLGRVQVGEILTSMQSILEGWIDAIK
jgi:hypothetical protein